MSEFGDWIREARSKLAAARAAGTFPRAERPVWMKDGDALARALDEQQRLLREGQVVWSALVEANAELFHRGWIDFPALVIHAADGAQDDGPQALLELAPRLFDLRGGGGANNEEREFGAMLDDEQGRPSWRKVPRSMSPQQELHASSVLIVRPWLPGTSLAGLPLPLLAHPARTGQVLPLPLEYWPEALRARWLEHAPEAPEEQEELRVGGLGFLFPIALLGSLVFLPALIDRIGLWRGEAAPARDRWLLTLAVPAILIGLVGWLRKKLRRTPTQRDVFEATHGYRIRLRSDDDLGLPLAHWAGLMVLVATVLKYVLPK